MRSKGKTIYVDPSEIVGQKGFNVHSFHSSASSTQQSSVGLNVLTGPSSDSKNYVTLSCSSLGFDVPLLATSKERKVHGPEVLIKGAPGWFESRDIPPYTIDLPCNQYSQQVFLNGPINMRFYIRKDVKPETLMNDPCVSIVLELIARHCKSDKGEEIGHMYGYAVVPLCLFMTNNPLIQVVLKDRPMEFEFVYARRCFQAGGRSVETTDLLKLQELYKKRHNRELFERMVISFNNARITDSNGNILTNPFQSSGSSLPVLAWDFLGVASRSVNAMQQAKQVFAAYKNATYAPFGGLGEYKGFKPIHQSIESYFVPEYNIMCGIPSPSGPSLMLSSLSHTPRERIYSHLIRAQLNRHMMKESDFIYSCYAVLGAHYSWCNQAPIGKVHGDNNTKKQLWGGSEYFQNKSGINHKQEQCIELIILAISSIANAVSYTTDFAELEVDISAAGSKPSNINGKGIHEIVTEQFETDIETTRGGDCEDCAFHAKELFAALVENIGAWSDPVVAVAAAVMDLYVPVINKMHCGECHILSTFWLRDYAYCVSMFGLHAVPLSDRSTNEIKKWELGILDTCYWPNYMYNNRHGSQGHRTDLHTLLLQDHNRQLQWPLPPVLYAEPTRVSPPNQRPHDVMYCTDGDTYRKHIGMMHSKANRSRELCRSHTSLQDLEPCLTLPNYMSRAKAMDPNSRLSNFYQRHIMACMICPVYKVTYAEVLSSAPSGAIRVPITESLLARANYYVDLSYHDITAPRTFGILHSKVVSSVPEVALVPFVPMTAEFLIWMARVRSCEAPIVASDIPKSMHKLHPSQLGQFEPIPQLTRHADIKVHNDKGIATISGPDSNQFARLEFIPHDGALIEPRELVQALGRGTNATSGLIAMRVPLCEPPIAPSPFYSSDQISLLMKMNNEMGLATMDACELTAYLEKTRLNEIASQRSILTKYNKTQWDLYRHWLGYKVRARPIYLNVLTVIQSIFN